MNINTEVIGDPLYKVTLEMNRRDLNNLYTQIGKTQGEEGYQLYKALGDLLKKGENK
mgnify:CR=1 FL=1